MLPAITITTEDIFHQVQLTCQIPEIIEGIVTRKIIAATAESAGIRVEIEDLQKAADQFRLMNKLENSEDTWAWLQQHSMSLDDFEEIVYTNLIAGKVVQNLFADKVEPYFFEHQLDYASAVIYEVVLDDQELAMELFYALDEGETSFYEIAHEYIQDTELRRSGGYRGIVKRQEFKPEISAAVFAAEPPQLLKPIVSSKGVHLILVEEILKSELDGKLRSEIMSDLFTGWLKEQIGEVEVVKQLDSQID
ncbi:MULTISPECIES: peptidylprolyl isomerase [unclassified Moorena]|uniref:foldase protein PrsA n=1 Tax=unclassified Moorena TaxID=2683338 RepID=UPI001400BD13|nr:MULTISPECIES: peptidylprolyl isomerase [unclassified Moorena]NEO12816.1 peptidylprolyl isomerase [Moorena sp. SIO3E8]NEP99591.1 peptidylprolyl isomerase [Moorena sp. SIO3F7]